MQSNCPKYNNGSMKSGLTLPYPRAINHSMKRDIQFFLLFLQAPPMPFLVFQPLPKQLPAPQIKRAWLVPQKVYISLAPRCTYSSFQP